MKRKKCKTFLFGCLATVFCHAAVAQSDTIASLRTQESSFSSDSMRKDLNPAAEHIIDGKVYFVLVTKDDTLVLAQLDDISISSPRTFVNHDEYKKYMRYKYYAAKVYPYAREAIIIFRKLEYATKNMKKKQRKKYIKQLQKELEVEFEQPLKNLSKTQGKILVKMIERELDTPMHNLIRSLNGKWKAFYWNQSSKLYGYRLKSGYIEGENPILDIVLKDLNISYRVEDSSSDQ